MKRIDAIAAVAHDAMGCPSNLQHRLSKQRTLRCCRSSRKFLYARINGHGIVHRPWPRTGSAQRRVVVLDGDGSILMNLGTLATIANCAPDNYLLVILDNCCYGSTGSQPTCTSGRSDLAKMAKAAGVDNVQGCERH